MLASVQSVTSHRWNGAWGLDKKRQYVVGMGFDDADADVSHPLTMTHSSIQIQLLYVPSSCLRYLVYQCLWLWD